MDEKNPYNTAKQIAKKHSKEVWYNSWIQNDMGRALFKYQPTPDPRDAIHQLERKDQCSIFRLRTGHAVYYGTCIETGWIPKRHPIADTVTTHMRLLTITCYIVETSQS